MNIKRQHLTKIWLSLDNKFVDAPPCVSLWRRIMDTDALMQQSLECSWEKPYVRSSVQYELRTISAFDPTMSCMNSVRMNVDVVECINIQRRYWLGHVIQMDEDASAGRLFNAKIFWRRRRGQPFLCWKF